MSSNESNNSNNSNSLPELEKKLPKASADVVGKLREKFDVSKIKTSIRKPIEIWINEILSS